MTDNTYVKLDGAIDQGRGSLQQDGLGLLGASAIQSKLGVPAFLVRYLLNVLDKLELIYL